MVGKLSRERISWLQPSGKFEKKVDWLSIPKQLGLLENLQVMQLICNLVLHKALVSSENLRFS